MKDLVNVEPEDKERKDKLTDWKNEPTFEDLDSDYKNALPYHSEHIEKIKHWLDLLNPKSDKSAVSKGRSGLRPKVIRRLIEWRNASLTTTFLNKSNLFQVKPTSPKYIEASLQNELILNYQFNSLIGKVKFINELIRTITAEGTVIVRVGWEELFQTQEKELPVYQYVQANPQEEMMLQNAMQQIAQEVDQTGVSTTESQVFQSLEPVLQESINASMEYNAPIMAQDTGETQIVKEEVQVKNRPVLDVVSANNIIIDPTCNGDMSKAKFIIYTYATTLSELKSSGVNKYLDRLWNKEVNISGDDIAELPDDIIENTNISDIANTRFKFKDKPRKTVIAKEYWGYWDIDGTGITQGFVATIVNNTIIRLERNPFPDGELPFVVIPYMPVKKSIYGEPDAELIEDNQEVIGATMRSMIDITARSANGQMAIPKGFVDDLNLAKFRNGEDYQYNPIGMHPSQAVYTHTSGEIPNSALSLVQSQFAMAESATGIKSFNNGIDGNAYGQVVAGMSQAITAMTQREGDIVFRLSEGLEKIGNKIIAMNALWLNEQEFVEISDNEFIDIYRDSLKGEFKLTVGVKSNSESEGKAQQLTFLAQTLGAEADWGIRRIYMIEICRLYGLDSMAMAIQKYEPQPDPLEQKRKELEIAELEARVDKLRKEALYAEKRAEFIDVQVDNANLEFVEQSEGVHHARNKDLTQAQAKAQNEGKILQEYIKQKGTLEKARIDMGKTGQKDKSKTGLPRPDLGTPRNLTRADNISNYIHGDNDTL